MPDTAEVGNGGIQKLDEAAKEHQKKIVIDLGSDRFIKWIGVYLFLALAVIVKFAEAVGKLGYILWSFIYMLF